ncbi:MAG TPA: alanine--tRNA ligase, partial [Sulfitobacter pontiacus]
RRIEALTGTEALKWLRTQETALTRVAAELKTSTADVPDRVRALLDERRALANEVAQLRRELAMSGGGDASAAAPREVNGIKFIAQVVNGVTGKDLPALIDEHKAKLGSGAVLLIADADGKAAVAAGVTADLAASISAVDIVKTVVAELGGKGGGGRPEMAQGGAKDVANAEAAIAAAENVLKG